MNGMGRQGQRSGAAVRNHQRQYSDDYLDASSNGRWLQTAGLQSLYSNTSAPQFNRRAMWKWMALVHFLFPCLCFLLDPISSEKPEFVSIASSWVSIAFGKLLKLKAYYPAPDYGFSVGGGGQGSRMYNRNAQRSFGGMNEYYMEPSTPPGNSRPSSQRKSREDSPSDFSPGLLDLHSFDTELLPEDRGFDDSDVFISNNIQTSRPQDMTENNLLKSVAADKERANSVAKIKVVVRKRPLNKKELAKNEEDIVETTANYLTVHETKLKASFATYCFHKLLNCNAVDLTEYVEKHEFVFDAVLNEEVSNDEVYRETVEPIVPIIFQRTKATCFAYGQTGSGKTFTMKPLPLKASKDILRLMHHTYRNQGFHLFVSFFEIYGGKLYDLLNDRKKLCMREDGKQQVCIVGLQEYKVSDVETIGELIEKGNATRSTGTTGANEESSRSHAILQLAVKNSVSGKESKPPRLVGKLSFIDLAGSERGADTTDNDKQTRIEGAEINKSLLALKECIRALDNDQGHIPFRGSKLTEVLRDSFVGNSRTVMISCISPSSGSCEHTLNTLRYADRVKSLSKGNNVKKDTFSSTLNLKESTTGPLTSALPSGTMFENEPAWVGRNEREEVDASEEIFEQRKPSWKKNGKLEPFRTSVAVENVQKSNNQPKWKDMPKADSHNSNSDDDLNELLQEEEDLISAHRKQVEETMNIVRMEMNLLVEADQPGNHLDGYISRLNAILSQKAAAIYQLQNHLVHFQKRLKEHNVLISSSD
ncbi:kinesin-13A [Cucumis melo var. makuwa]|uniref:Kinesin-like protein n=1 Tax=Cucumis melo var. makuwa TaxID=1194695 RepID=A0A5A7UXE4_CUCMM|nr:kinesin-13A [Cucumis melo var. makuwa]